MGTIVTTSIICDNCSQATESLEDPDQPLPNDWLRVQGYAIILNGSNGSSVELSCVFCPGCVSSQGTRSLVKKAADITSGLTNGP